MREAVIVSTARTGLAKSHRGGFNNTGGVAMAGHAIAHSIERAGIEPGEVSEVVLGCGTPQGTTGNNIGRVAALKAGAEFIDCEYDNFIILENQERIRLALSHSPRGRLILSAHNFVTRFDNILKLFRNISNACPGAIPKLVYTANHITDCFEGFDLLNRTSAERIVFCMGPAGLISRILARKLGCFLTFASLDDDTATAPGQLTAGQLKKLYRFDGIDAETRLFGVIANPVGHSLSRPRCRRRRSRRIAGARCGR